MSELVSQVQKLVHVLSSIDATLVFILLVLLFKDMGGKR